MSQPSLENERQVVDRIEREKPQKGRLSLPREKSGEWVTIKPFPLWMLVICGLVFFFAGFFSARHGSYTAMSVANGNSPVALPAVQAVPTSSAPAANVAQGSAAHANASALIHVLMRNMKFSPATIEIKKGDTVEWTNQDITPHTATAQELFDSGSIASDKSWKHTFTQAGTFHYGCTFHPDMKGVVVVK